jgi:hypothetical protein
LLIIYLYIRNLLVNILPQCGYAYEIIVSYVDSTDCLSGKRFPFEVKTVCGQKYLSVFTAHGQILRSN